MAPIPVPPPVMTKTMPLTPKSSVADSCGMLPADPMLNAIKASGYEGKENRFYVTVSGHGVLA